MSKRLSASRLNDFLGCSHHAALWLAGEQAPEEDNASLQLIRDKGFEHEARVLKRLEANYGAAVSISDKASLESRVMETLAAITNGAALIYQGALANSRWLGFPDFLVRNGRAADGTWTYEPEDAKLARKAKAEHVLQLGIYSELLNEVATCPVAGGAIHVGEGDPERFDLKRTRYITARLKRKFEAFADLAVRETRPVRTAACDQCPFHPKCEAEWRAADSPVFVAGIRGDQIIKLEAAGITTFSVLAGLDPAAPMEGIGKGSFAKLVNQARLQKLGVERGEGLVELLEIEAGRGFTLLPAPEAGDLYFDMEGDPLYPEGLEYLFGLYGPLGSDDTNTFVPIWAHDHAAEKLAFEELMRLFIDHLSRFPRAHIYHYAPYETAALKRLAMRYATMEAELDQLLREKRFVDLYLVVRQAIRASTEGYSLKDMEKIYWGKRTGDVTNAGDSIVEYERWRETGDQAILDGISHYNEDDCVSTERMRDWLEGLRPKGANYGLVEAEPETDPAAEQRALDRKAFEEERRALASAVRANSDLDPASRDLIAELLWFHQRSQKPQWWALFDRQTWSEEDLFDDLESLGGLTLDAETPVFKDKQSYVATYRFEPQDTKLKEGDPCKIALTLEPAGTIVALDTDDGRVVVRRHTKAGAYPERCSFIPGRLIDQSVLIDAVVAFARRVAAGSTGNDRALLDLIGRQYPRLAKVKSGESLIPSGVALLAGAVEAVGRLQDSYLVIQGPPGTGKTYTTSHAILALLKAGKRIAVSSNSHKAINNLLAAVEERANEAKFSFLGAKRATKGNAETTFEGRFIKPAYNKDDVIPALLVGATAFHFAQPEELAAYDYLFVDEAGQVSLGNLIAMASCARNIVLVGDQMQLPQPVQGVHPGESGFSCLDYLMQNHATVPSDRGILLNVSWRMHPALCEFISEAFYEGRLTSHPETAVRRIVLNESADPILRPAGIAILEVAHKGCTQSSVEEAMAVERLVQSLLRQAVRDKTGAVRPFTLKDVLVVAPFNAQVNLLRKHLPAGARVGTVDKFQGQEASVAIVSMATSNGANAPRGTEFLFNANRLNVAVSRAQCLAIIVRGKDLLELSPGSIEDLERLEGFARADAVCTASAI
jgi:predicted RecB family nuclease